MGHVGKDILNNTSRGMLGLALIGAPLLFGGAFGWTVPFITGVFILAFALVSATQWSRLDKPVPIIWIVVAAGWFWTAVQSIPLPINLARPLASIPVDRIERTLALVRSAGPIDSASLSYDPGATQVQLLVGASIVTAFVCAWLVSSRHRNLVIQLVALSSIALAMITIAHRLAGLDSVYGVYTPRFTAAVLVAPLMNANHLGGFLMMGSLLSFSISMDARNANRRWPWLGAGVVLGALVPLTTSRGATATLLVGLTAIFFLVRSRSKSRNNRRVLVGSGIASIFGVAAFMGLEPLLRRFETADVSKFELARQGLDLLQGPAAWIGVGRGAFSVAMAEVHSGNARVTHPENLIVQWTSEWGLIVGLPLLCAIAFAVYRRLRSTRSITIEGGAIAIIALGAQNLVDFSLEMPGVAPVAAALLGAVLYSELPSFRIARFSQRAFVSTVGTFAVACLVLLSPRCTAIGSAVNSG